MPVLTGRNFEIRTSGGVADCRVWRRPDLSREEGAKCGDELCEALAALATSNQVKALVLDLHEAPPPGPLTQRAIERLMRAAETAARPVAVVCSSDALQRMQLRRIVTESAPKQGRVFEDGGEARTWVQNSPVR